MERVIDSVVEANPDAILLAPGQADLLQRRVGREKPALVLRVDAPNVYGREVPERAGLHPVRRPGRDGGPARRRLRGHEPARLAGPAVAAPELRRERDAAARRLRPGGHADDGRAVPMAPATAGYDVHRDPERLRGLVRQAVELGADVIKADPLPDAQDFARVVRTARVPLLVRGGGRVAVEELMELTASVLSAGALGLVYGRNVIQHDDPPAMARALGALVHDGATAQEALARLA